MATTSPTIEKARVLLRERRNEIRAELEQIEQALGSLEGSPQAKRGPGRPRKSRGRKASKGSKRRRSRRGGTRADHAAKLVAESPGLTASEIASALGIKPNYVYRVMGDLVEDGKVTKRGKGFFPTADASSPANSDERDEPAPAAEAAQAEPTPAQATPAEEAALRQPPAPNPTSQRDPLV